MASVIIEEVTLGDANRQDGVPEGVIKTVHKSVEVYLTSTAADVTLEGEGNTVIVTAMGGDVLAHVSDPSDTFSATKAKIILSGQDVALHYKTGDVLHTKAYSGLGL